ncbi:hypothetical protein A3D11_02840 [Candidatus Peribacteria bacterium RIFCSPHIGHO2_02_FULL_49_16]|nr:MAG: hypothetical protein A2880_01720 [Candidatus Peribacteria bacterium RIFCSPHIGHO2_01_FULL_49_38]OGJ58526.1 MAG: hypothetical protein A3D11_02840 [Candidatus Peribacteria bacterium RIFCSPHIGHO2_02_FULL_49_16]
MIAIQPATDLQTWNSFLASQPFSPFLQSFEMGEVYRDLGQEPIRLEIWEDGKIVGTCFGHVVPARRGRHLAIPYGPVIAASCRQETVRLLMEALKDSASTHHCSFIRISPFWKNNSPYQIPYAKSAPLHLLAEHIWLLDLKEKTGEDILKDMRKTTRNLIRRAEKEGVQVRASDDPLRDLPIFLKLHEETRKRHSFTPYTNAFFEAQVRNFHKKSRTDVTCTLYIATYNLEPIASSIHMHFGGETSYHHGASTHKYPKIPASYLLQWTAIQDALTHGDHLYNFWGVAPRGLQPKKHPFAGVTTFKIGFGGYPLELMHCIDIPLKSSYYLTRGFETLRKWKRGF